MNNWKETTLKESIKIIDGDRGVNYPKNDEFSSNGYCLFLNTKNVPDVEFSFTEKMFITKEKDEKLKKGKLQRNDFVLTTRGTIGNFAYYSEKILFENIRINSGMVILRVNEHILERDYFKFYLRSQLFRRQILQLSSGTAQPQLPIRDLNFFLITTPSIPEQKEIARVLSSLDDKIELLRNQNEMLEKIAQTIFKEWFVNFNLPAEVLTKVGVNGKKLKLKNGIPEGWRVGKYNDLVDVVTGKGIKKEDLISSGQYKVLGANGEIGRTDVYLFNESIILTGRVGTLGTIYISKGKVWISDNVLISKAKSEENFYFAYFNLRRFNFDSLNRGSTQPLITQTDLKNIEIIIPAQDTLKEWHNVVSKMFDKIYLNNSQIQTLSRLRDTLLPKLMSGEININI
ncbi:EcoKI restriction-modification system protein HsdS [bacterium BMS3Abin15]|nr:EcoKI restriction-modification system protein HsdS [bacterium BMS3Abin15]